MLNMFIYILLIIIYYTLFNIGQWGIEPSGHPSMGSTSPGLTVLVTDRSFPRSVSAVSAVSDLWVIRWVPLGMPDWN